MCWGVLLAATLLGIAVQGVYAAALPLSDIVRPSLISAVLGTRFGRVEMLRVVLTAWLHPGTAGHAGSPWWRRPALEVDRSHGVWLLA